MAVASNPTQLPADESGVLEVALIGLTFSTGLIDALSFLGLGQVLTANMTGNVVFLAFAVAGVQGLSAARSGVALLAFMLGSLVGGIIDVRHSGWSRIRLLKKALAIEAALLLAAASLAVIKPGPAFIYGLIVLTAVAMGMRNAVVRKLAVPDLTTTVLTMTVTGLASDSSLAGGTNPRWKIRLTSIGAMFAGAALGAMLLRHGLMVPLAVSFSVALGAFAWLSIRDSTLPSR